MRARLEHIRESLRASLWLVPASMSLGSVALAVGMLRLDASLPEGALPAAIGFHAGADAARALLTTLAGAMMGVTGVTFSITVVALSLASQQFGPRLLRNFLRDRVNHLTLGTFLATFVYTLLVLQAIEEDAPADALPRISVTVAMGLALASLAVLITFVHHVAHSIQADHILHGVARELHDNVDRMYPERMGEDAPERDPSARVPEDLDERARVVRARDSGYLQAVDESKLLALAEEHDLIVRLVPRPGDFVIENSPLLLAYPPERLDEAFDAEVRALLMLGMKRTPEQDVEFSIDQLVEVAVRALSPGINDPFTATRCVDRLGAALCRLCSRRFPSPYREGADGRLRVMATRPTFGGLVRASFTQIRQYGRPSASVTIRLLETLEVVGGCARTEAQREPLREEVEKVWQGAQEAHHSPPDLADIERRHRDALAALAPDGRDPTGVAMQPRKRQDPA